MCESMLYKAFQIPLALAIRECRKTGHVFFFAVYSSIVSTALFCSFIFGGTCLDHNGFLSVKVNEVESVNAQVQKHLEASFGDLQSLSKTAVDSLLSNGFENKNVEATDSAPYKSSSHNIFCSLVLHVATLYFMMSVSVPHVLHCVYIFLSFALLRWQVSNGLC